MIEHLASCRTLYRIRPNRGNFFRHEAWIVQKWRWYWPFWTTIHKTRSEQWANDYLASLQRNYVYYEL